MNFNRNKRNKEKEPEKKNNSRFSDLKVDNNPFKNSFSDKSDRQGEREERKRSRPKRAAPAIRTGVTILDLIKKEQYKNIIISDSTSESNSSYVPPHKRNEKSNNQFKKKEENKFKKTFTNSKLPKKKKEQIAPDFDNSELFPTLAPEKIILDKGNAWSKKMVVKEKDEKAESEDESEDESQDESQDKSDTETESENKEVSDTKKTWAEMAIIKKYQDASVKEDDPNFIKPGWIRISYDKETHNFVHEYGAEVPETPLMKLLREDEKRRKQLEWERRQEEWDAYEECMGYKDNYYYSWQADEIDAMRELDERIAREEQEEYEEAMASDNESDEYYDDYY